ncbi:MAG: hypothetical protein AAB791_00615, partial [Patescibacteria group bacterium]
MVKITVWLALSSLVLPFSGVLAAGNVSQSSLSWLQVLGRNLVYQNKQVVNKMNDWFADRVIDLNKNLDKRLVLGSKILETTNTIYGAPVKLVSRWILSNPFPRVAGEYEGQEVKSEFANAPATSMFNAMTSLSSIFRNLLVNSIKKVSQGNSLIVMYLSPEEKKEGIASGTAAGQATGGIRVITETEKVVYVEKIIGSIASSTPAIPSDFLQRNDFLVEKEGMYFYGNNKFGGSISFDPGTIIDFSGTSMFNLPFTIGGGGGGGSSTVINNTGVTDHGVLTGLTDDDHTQYGALAQDEVVTGEWIFSGNLNVVSVTTTGTLAVAGYASSTGGLYTQGDLHVGGTASFDGLVSGAGVTLAQQNFWNTTSTWAYYDTNWNRNYNATTTLNGFAPGDYISYTNWYASTTREAMRLNGQTSDYYATSSGLFTKLAVSEFGTYFDSEYNATTTLNGFTPGNYLTL